MIAKHFANIKYYVSAIESITSYSIFKQQLMNNAYYGIVLLMEI